MVSRLTNFATREEETRARFVLVRLVCLLLVQQLFPATLLAADLSIQSYVDRSTLRVGKQFTLSVDLSGADSDKVANPQPPALDAFARYVGGGTSTSVEVVNGRMSSRRTLSFYYQASEEGKFQIPQISISFEGKDYRTQPINIEIILGQGNLSPPAAPSSRTPLGRVPASQNGITSEDLFVRASVNKTRVYQNETIILTYKIYTRVNVSRYGIAKAPDRSGFWVEDLQGEKRPLQTSTEVIDDRRYTVTTIQRLALFSASPGKKRLSRWSWNAKSLFLQLADVSSTISSTLDSADPPATRSTQNLLKSKCCPFQKPGNRTISVLLSATSPSPEGSTNPTWLPTRW